ncbi:MAG: DUF3050 domain-containing protein [Flavobacteriaceae bacterium]|nr:DUF3050 domain-containing protein [Flavobacteriaceae bacterium]
MNEIVNSIRQEIEPLRNKIINHKVYSVINDIDDLKVFMEYHVYAVWDFMSLLKSLQINLTCVSIPWYPKGSAETRYLINTIVAEEECDIDQNGIRKSHFEMYLDAMKQCNANTKTVQDLLSTLITTNNICSSATISNIPQEAKEFVKSTFNVIKSNKVHLQAAIFTFGREDLIPGMFISLVNKLYQKFPESISNLKYYLERHIEVDGGSHGELALQMTSNLCGNDKALWLEAKTAIIETLQNRIKLWDAVYNEINKRNNHSKKEINYQKIIV